MMLVALLNIPRTADEWQQWSWHHRLSHDAIRAAILKQKNINLTDYQVEPINPDDMTGFLQRNEQLHTDMDGVLGTQSVDLQDTDMKDIKQLTAWVYLHFLEHQTAEQTLKI